MNKKMCVMQNESSKEVPVLCMVLTAKDRIKPIVTFVCSHTGKICEKGRPLDLLKFQTIRINEKTGDCTEKSHCLNFPCPSNKTTYESYAAYHDWPEVNTPKLKRKWHNDAMLMVVYNSAADLCMQEYAKNPNIRMFAFSNKKPSGGD